jgi:hypothetical protein
MTRVFGNHFCKPSQTPRAIIITRIPALAKSNMGEMFIIT